MRRSVFGRRAFYWWIMILYYVRHGDPIYDPDSLTELGHKQAKALAKRFSLYGLDEVYSSPSKRAMQTAKPTSELTKLKITEVDFADEAHVWRDLTVKTERGDRWLFQHAQSRALLTSREVRELGDGWYKHPSLAKYEEGIMRVYDNTDAFLSTLGYEHERYTGRYKVLCDNGERVALFAHQGFGLAFLSVVLGIPYPQFSTTFDFGHSGLTLIEFKNEDGFAYPRVLTLANDSHIYREGLPTKYQNSIYF